MQVTAQLNYLRIAPRKVRLVGMALKGMPVEKAQAELSFRIKRSAVPLAKLLKSAISNAENNFGLVKENLFIKNVIVNEGVKIKRYMPRAMGQAGMIQKKSSHIKIILEEKVPGLKMKKPEPAIKEVKPEPSEKAQEKFKKPVVEAKKPVLKKEVFGGVRKFFRRKSI
ncbi:MAG: 50S ribosomal protein L22 [Candidatus Yanofskybacteria bacterium RIFCSPHIGHO2_02_FULL_43_15c]|uniref:Large ribosomal subunit protein uL22 n=2 Tax=Candidatus Yanofskyibacteriota TaxID=1752733 RepID=A0A1F8GZA1_9BACT|nr:MAG: 50S ribosomal protein L22 [Candidatus Yanofskybacteria bacterium RIFCSPHIGHO2_02_FULL_43_15c]OGN30752.1 MAG: 50S ribosomal protein L22 [Candidatus Yanofskybacteria bacterium RIFCSPLOWO2_02_FULL_43_10b]